ncbi:MAG: hypothetical protein WBN45_10140 [Arenicellales bacterium]|jgi:hypothetical protein
MDKLVSDATMRNNISYYEEKLNKLGITIEEMSKTLESDEDRWKERKTVSVSTFLLVVIVIGIIFSAFVSVI